MSNSDAKLIETHWWTLLVSDDWDIDSEEGTVIISDRDGIGSLELTVIELDGAPAGDLELGELAAEFVPAGVAGASVVCGDWPGLLFTYSEGDYCRDWVLHCDDNVLIISYTSAAQHRGMDDTAVDQMLAELGRAPGR